MGKRYTPKKFSPIIFQEWGELFKELTPEQKSEVLMGITMFPEYEVTGVPIWSFIRSQLQNQLDSFTDKCQKNGETIRTYWETMGNERLTNDNERSTKRNEGKPKPELLPEPEYKPELLPEKNQLDNQDENQDAIQVVDKDKDKDKEVDKDILTNLTNNNIYNNKNKVVISSKFSISGVPELRSYVDEMPEDVIDSVEKWLIKTKQGQMVDIPFITKQFFNFAKRMGRPFFKECA